MLVHSYIVLINYIIIEHHLLTLNIFFVFIDRTREFLSEGNYTQIMNVFVMFEDRTLEPAQLFIRIHQIIHRSFGYYLQSHFQHSQTLDIIAKMETSRKRKTELYKLLTLLFPIPLRPFICKMLVD